ncbi:hypothetical protein KCU98_g527, partial [Aureobasidium melanogenum]
MRLCKGRNKAADLSTMPKVNTAEETLWYRIVALDTIDVDILDHREHRTTVMAEFQHSNLEKKLVPGTDFHAKLELVKPQKTQLIRDVNGEYKLVPRQMLLAARGGGQLTEARDAVSAKEEQTSAAPFLLERNEALENAKKLQSRLTASEDKIKKLEAHAQQPIIVNTTFISRPVANSTAWGNPATPTLSGVGVVGLSWVGFWLGWEVEAGGEDPGGTGGEVERWRKDRGSEKNPGGKASGWKVKEWLKE